MDDTNENSPSTPPRRLSTESLEIIFGAILAEVPRHLFVIRLATLGVDLDQRRLMIAVFDRVLEATRGFNEHD